MKCETIRSLVHSYLDGELSIETEAIIEGHLEECQCCRGHFEGFSRLQQALAQPVKMPEPMREAMWNKIRRRSVLGIGARLKEGLSGCRIYWRDFDRQVLWSRAMAVPVSLLLFLALLPQIQHDRLLHLNYPVFNAEFPQASFMVSVAVGRDEFSRMDQMFDAVEEIPDEDSAAVVIDFDATGQMEIGEVLEWPKDGKMLQALDDSLQGLRIGPTSEGGDRKMIAIMHKVNVTEKMSTVRGM